MRITLPIDVWDPARGGAERYLARMSDELASRGHEVTVLCIAAAKASAARHAARVEILDVPHFPRWRRELRFAEAAVRAHRASGRDILFQVRHALEADIYQPHGGSYLASRQAQGHALSGPRRILRDALAGLRPTTRLLKRLDRAVFDHSPGVITLSVSARVEEDFRRAYPDIAFHFERLHNPVDSDRFHDRDRADCRARLLLQFKISPGHRVALFTAHRFRPKGLEFAIEALRHAPEWHLVVLGRDAPGPFARLARRFEVSGRTHFGGAVDDVRPFQAGSDAFLLPTLYDPCSLSVLEALACGTPAITTSANGASDVLLEGVSGFILSRPSDARAIAMALQATADRWDALHAGARAAALRLGWKEHLDRLELVLCQIGPRP